MRFSFAARRSCVGALLGATLLIGAPLLAVQASADDPFYITDVVFLGSGCPNGGGAVTELIDLDGNGLPEQFIILFSKDYIAAQGPGIDIVQQRRNCNLLVHLHLPDGYQAGVASALQAGYADLPNGIGATQHSDYVFTFHSETVSRETSLTGAFKDSYARQDDFGDAGLVWSRCGLAVPLNIRTQVYLHGDSTLPAAISMDYLAPTLIWRRCAADGAGRPTGVTR